MSRFFLIFIICCLPIMAWQNDNVDEFSFQLVSGEEIQMERISEEKFYQLPAPTGINYYFDEGVRLKVLGEKVYIDEAALFNSNLLIALNPWASERPSLIAGDILVLDPFDFLDLENQCNAFGFPSRIPLEYIIQEDLLLDEEVLYSVEEEFINRLIDHWQCDADVHNEVLHPTDGSKNAACHGQLGATGNCEKKGANGQANLTCRTRPQPTGTTVETCTAELSCNNGSLGTLPNGTRTSYIKCTSKGSSFSDFKINVSDDGVLEMQCNGNTTTLDCR